MNTNLKIFQDLFRLFISWFPDDNEYFNSHKSRDGLQGNQLMERHELTRAQGLKLSCVFHLWLDLVEDMNIDDRMKRRLVNCTYRFGTRKTTGFSCGSNVLCPWCRSYLIHNATLFNRRQSTTVSVHGRMGPLYELKSIFRPPVNTVAAVRNIGVTLDGSLAAGAVFLRDLKSKKVDEQWDSQIESLLRFNLKIVTDPDLLVEYLSLMKNVKMFTRTRAGRYGRVCENFGKST